MTYALLVSVAGLVTGEILLLSSLITLASATLETMEDFKNRLVGKCKF